LIREINPDIPDWLERIVLKLLEKHADDRLSTALEVAALLEQCLAHVQQPTTVDLPRGIGDWSLHGATGGNSEFAVPPLGGSFSKASSTGSQESNVQSSETGMRLQNSSSVTRRRLLLGTVSVLAIAGLSIWLQSQKTATSIKDSFRQETQQASGGSSEQTMNPPADSSPANNPPLEWAATQSELDVTSLSIDHLETELNALDPNSASTINPQKEDEQ
jgi:hypothetical protein